MAKLRGNKGEWSEIYVFLKLLGEGRLYAADESLNKNEAVFYNILGIVRTEKKTEAEYLVSGDECSAGKGLFQKDFKLEAQRLFEAIKASRGSSFCVPETEEFLSSIGVCTLKAKSADKADIKIRIHDINSGYETVQGFSIKSRLGNSSTLINAGRTTNFIYEAVGAINDEVMRDFNKAASNIKFKERFSLLRRAGCDLRYADMANKTFKNNLVLIDGALPDITAEMLKAYYMAGITEISRAVEKIAEDNPLGYDMSEGHPYYSYKFKKLLTECALGMLPSKTWTGRADATGGYIIVREDGEVLCYHLFNRNEFENYLLENTRFETASTSRHGFGFIYKEGGRYYLKLNLQVRFMK